MSSSGPPRYAIARHRPQQNVAPTPTKAAAPRTKVIIRRLPPGLTEPEFHIFLGDDWELGREKVDWASYKPGKVSKDPAKPSKPSRAYLHLTNADYLSTLTEQVQTSQFVDARASGGDPVLLGPPTVEYAPCGRIPNSKIRKDARQGTIDQDPEFIDFLESLTNPTPKPTQPEGESDTETKKEEIKVTPLIQYLRDKKANKSKELGTSGKTARHSRNDSKDGKTSQASDKKASPKDARDSTQQADKRNASAIKAVKAAHDAVKLLNKQVHASNKISSPSSSTPPSSTVPAQASKSPAAIPDRKRERGTVSAAARIQRDLGLAGSSGGRRKRDAPASSVASSTTTSNGKPNTDPQPQVTIATNPTSSPSSVSSPPSTRTDGPSSTSTSQRTPNQPPTGPAASRTIMKPQTSVPPRPQQVPSTVAPNPPPVPSTATQAFLKHANPSQGITEPLLEQAFAIFGSVTKVEIDKKKGFAYVDFEEPEGLQKAMAASPVKVAQGQVVVLERKTGPTLQTRNVRGGPAMGPGRGGMPPMVPRGGRGGGGRGRGGTARSTPMRPAAPTAKDTPGSAAAPSKAAPVPESVPVSVLAPAPETKSA